MRLHPAGSWSQVVFPGAQFWGHSCLMSSSVVWRGDQGHPQLGGLHQVGWEFSSTGCQEGSAEGSGQVGSDPLYEGQQGKFGSCTWITAAQAALQAEGRVAGKLPRGKGPGRAGQQQLDISMGKAAHFPFQVSPWEQELVCTRLGEGRRGESAWFLCFWFEWILPVFWLN